MIHEIKYRKGRSNKLALKRSGNSKLDMKITKYFYTIFIKLNLGKN